MKSKKKIVEGLVVAGIGVLSLTMLVNPSPMEKLDLEDIEVAMGEVKGGILDGLLSKEYLEMREAVKVSCEQIATRAVEQTMTETELQYEIAEAGVLWRQAKFNRALEEENSQILDTASLEYSEMTFKEMLKELLYNQNTCR